MMLFMWKINDRVCWVDEVTINRGICEKFVPAQDQQVTRRNPKYILSQNYNAAVFYFDISLCIKRWVAYQVFQAISEFVRGYMKPCRWKFDRIMLRSISKQQKWEMFHTRLNNFHVFRKFCIALYGRYGNKRSFSMNWNLMLNFLKLKQMIFKRHSSSYWPNVGVGNFEKFKLLTSWQAPGTQTAVLTNQIRAQPTVL